MSTASPRVRPVDRLRQARRLLAGHGPVSLTGRLRIRGANLLVPPGSRPVELTRAEIARAAEAAARDFHCPGPLPVVPGEGLRIAWVCAPPGPSSGGHTTMFRMVAALEAAGHHCEVYIRDNFGWSIEQHRARVRAHWPQVRAEVYDAAEGIADAHAIVATSWGTAYTVLGSPARGTRFYFVQDFEPAFAPAGSTSLLAEATYRFGFHGITAGAWLADRLRRDYGMAADHFDFGCDVSAYEFDGSPAAELRRTGVAYYSRPATPRRAHELAVMALDLVAQRHPDVPIHFYGEAVRGLPFRAEQRGLLSHVELGRLYNRCVAGLVLSATNVSLVPWEMLAAGCIPVVNDAPQNRQVLANEHVAYAPATPFDLAAAIGRLLDQPTDQRAARAADASSSVQSESWETAAKVVEQTIVGVVAGS